MYEETFDTIGDPGTGDPIMDELLGDPIGDATIDTLATLADEMGDPIASFNDLASEIGAPRVGALPRRPTPSALNPNVPAAANRLNRFTAAQNAARMLGGLAPRNVRIPFLWVDGGKVNSSPIPLESTMSRPEFELATMQARVNTPYQPQIVTGFPTLGNLRLTIEGPSGQDARFFQFGVLVKMGMTILTGLATGTMTVTFYYGSFIGGQLSAGPFSISYNGKFAMTIVFFPFVVVQTRVRPVLGVVRNQQGFTLVADFNGLPDGSNVALILPGTNHPDWNAAISRIIS
jgi:hypothetical protein